MQKIITTILAILVPLSLFASQPESQTPLTLVPAVAECDDDCAEDDDEWGFWYEAGFDLASNYMWRGYDQSYTGNAIEPELSVRRGLKTLTKGVDYIVEYKEALGSALRLFERL